MADGAIGRVPGGPVYEDRLGKGGKERMPPMARGEGPDDLEEMAPSGPLVEPAADLGPGVLSTRELDDVNPFELEDMSLTEIEQQIRSALDEVALVLGKGTFRITSEGRIEYGKGAKKTSDEEQARLKDVENLLMRLYVAKNKVGGK